MARAVEEWIGATDDTPIPDRVKVRIFERANGCCQMCTRKLRPRHWAADHIQALINGGQNRESNLQVLCSSPCHSRKTRRDTAAKSQTYRKRKANIGIRKPRTITRWRKMNGAPVYASRQR